MDVADNVPQEAVDVASLTASSDAARRQGQHAASLAIRRTLAAHEPGNLWAQLELAHDHMSLGEFDRAADAIRVAGAIAPDAPDIHFAHGRLARARNDRHASLAAHLAGAARVPGELGLRLEAAADHLALGDIAAAEAMLGQVLDAAPGDFHALAGLARCARARGDRRASLAHHRQARAAHPSSPWPLIEIGEDVLAMGDADEARDCYARARALAPDNVHALLGLARCARAAGDIAGSLAFHEAALAIEPDSVWIPIEMGADLLALGDVERARLSYEQAAARDGRNPHALFGLARCARARGDHRGSLALHETVAAIDAHGVWPAIEAARDLLALRDTEAARAQFRRALAIEPDHAEAQAGLAQCDAAAPAATPAETAWPAIEAASALLADGDHEAARAAYERALAIEPGQIDALFGLGRCARAAGDRQGSLAHFTAVCAADPGNLWAAVERGADLLALGHRDRAREAYESAAAIDPANVQALFGLARCARAAGDHRQSLAHHEAALRAAPDGNVWALIERGRDFLALGEPERAASSYADAFAIAPDNVQVRMGLGYCARAMGDHRESLAQFEAADRAEPNMWAWIEIGTDLLALGETARAREFYERTLAADAHNVQALLGRARCASVAGDIAGAVAAGRETVRLLPHDPWAHLELSTNLRALGDLDAAEAACQRAAALAPDRPEPLVGLCHCARLRGDRRAALAHAEAAHALAPDHTEALVAIGTEQRALDRADAAHDAFTRARALRPGHLEALFGLAGLARLRADRQAALALLREACARNPADARAALELAAELRALGLFGEARAVVRDGMSRHSNDLWFRLELGAIERGAGDLEASRAHYLQAAADHPPRAVLALIEAATVERELGRTESAAALLDRAAALDPDNATLLVRRGEQAMATRDPAAAFHFFRAAHAHYPSDPGAALAAVEAMIELGHTADAEGVLDRLEALYPAARAAIRRARVTLLRRTGDWERARELASAAAADAPADFLVGLAHCELERLVGTEAHATRAIAVLPARAHGEIAVALSLAGEWAEECGDGRAASEAFLRAECLDGQNPGTQWALCRLAMHALDIERARHHLRRYAALTAGHVRARGGAPHPSQSHYGQILDELALDDAAVAHLHPAAGRPPEERMARALAYVADNPGSTAASLVAMVAAREIAGAFGRHDRSPNAPSPIPRRIVQFWDDPEPPPDIARFMGEWRDGSPGWSHTRLDDREARAFLHQHHGDVAAAAYDRLREPAQKADLLRLALLAEAGGVYLDADDRPRASAGALLDGGSALILYQEDFGTIGNNMLAAAPGHPVIRRAFEVALEAMLRGDRDVVWLSTGPGLITRVFAGWLADAGEGWRERLGEVTVLHRRELFRCMAVHCHAAYKRTDRHWSNSTFARANARGRMRPEAALG